MVAQYIFKSKRAFNRYEVVVFATSYSIALKKAMQLSNEKDEEWLELIEVREK